MKPLENPDLLHLQAAAGWLELGNHIEANEELEKITPKLRAHPDVLEVCWQVYAAAKKMGGLRRHCHGHHEACSRPGVHDGVCWHEGDCDLHGMSEDIRQQFYAQFSSTSCKTGSLKLLNPKSSAW